MEVPVAFDDGDLPDQRPRTLKVFFDMIPEQTLTRERWGASRFVRNQRRLAAHNTWDPPTEPQGLAIEWALASTESNLKTRAEKTTKILLEMIRPVSPPDMSEANVFANLKRANVVLLTKTHVYVRMASATGSSFA